jgi:integrase
VHGHRLRKRYGAVPFKVAEQLTERDRTALRVAVLTTGKRPAAKLPVTDLTVAAALARYERDAFPTLRPRTRALYRKLMKPLREHLGSIRLSALSPLDLERYKRERTAPTPDRPTTGHTTTNRQLALLSAVIERCRLWKLTTRPDNPVAAVKRFRESRGRERILTYEEEARLLSALREPDRVVVQLALECGARLQSELLSVVWADVHLETARPSLTITATHAKNGRPRHLPLSPDMAGQLRALQATSTSPFVFPATQGGFNHRFKRRYFRAVRALRLDGVGIYTLRHTWASRMFEAGADLVLLKELGGWASLTMISRYSHHRPERAVEATQCMLAARDRHSPQSSPRPMAAPVRSA